MHFKARFTQMYSRIPWEKVADPKGTAEHSTGIAALECTSYSDSCIYPILTLFIFSLDVT